MLGIGDKLPEFSVMGVKPGFMMHEENGESAFEEITQDSFEGKWKVIFYYPKDFTFVCPTEIAAFADLNEEFSDRDTVLVTASTDSEFTHWAWRKHQDELRDLSIPMLSDIKADLSKTLGIYDENVGVSQRAVFVVDPDQIVRFTMVTDLNVGRNPKEVLRVLDALQTDELCPCNWSKGDETIDLNEATKA